MRRRFLIVVCGLCCLAACQKIQSGIDDSAGYPIYLSAAVNQVPQTRAPYMPMEQDQLSAPTANYPLRTDVWGSTDSYVFKHEEMSPGKPYDGGEGSGGKVAIHTDAVFQSGDPQLLRAAIYNKDTKPLVYFVAFSPMSSASESWTTPDGEDAGKTASFTFSGNDDVMFAPQVQGQYAQDYSLSPTLNYHHLLTWLRIEIKADSKEVADSWGKITSMKIRSNSSVSINLQSGAYDGNNYKFENNDGTINSTDLVFSNPVDMYFYETVEEESYVGAELKKEKKFTDNLFLTTHTGEIPYGAEAKEVAYILCAPVDATVQTVVDGLDVPTAEYSIELITEKRTVTIPVDLRHKVDASVIAYEGSTRCTQFTLSLNFQMGNTVYLTTSISDWGAGGLVIGDFGDGEIKS